MTMLIRLLAVAALVAAVFSHASAQTINARTINASVVIATGNTFQTVLNAVGTPPSIRRSLTIDNNNATDSCWIYVGSGNATAGTSILLFAGWSYTRYFPYVPSDVIQATCASTSDTLYVDTQ